MHSYSISKVKRLMFFFLTLLVSEKGRSGVIAELSDSGLSAKAYIEASSIPFNSLFSMNVVLNKDSAAQELTAFKAEMPAHNHGMVLTPKITRLGAREWRIDGLKLHMKGKWTLIFEWEVKGKKSKTTYDIVI